MTPKKATPAASAGQPGRGSDRSQNTKFSFDCQTILDSIPADLRARNHWVTWKSVPRMDGKKPTKVPLDVKTERGAQANNPGTWAPFHNAVEFVSEWAGEDHTHIDKTGSEITGTVSEYPGYFFHADDQFCGIDLDDCRNPDTGEVAPWALEIIEHFNSYTELSQSGTGFHIIIMGRKPAGSRSRKGGIECYDRDRYFICTGNTIDGRDTIQARQTELETFLDKYLSSKPKQAPLNGKKPDARHTDVDAQTVQNRALRSESGEKIRLLLSGDNAGLPSDSDGDLSLCNPLVFFCGYIPDAEVLRIVDEIIRNSKRMRPKWDTVHRPADGATYGQMTIEKAIEGTKTRYQTRLDFTRVGGDLITKNGLSQKEIISAAFDGQKGCATIYIKLFSGRYCYDRAAGLWYLFDKHFWTLDKMGVSVRSCDDVQAAFRRVEAELNAETIEIAAEMRQTDSADDLAKLKEKEAKIQGQIKAIGVTISNLNSLHHRKQVVEFAGYGDDSLGVTGEQWDQKPYDLACKNGVVDLKTGELKQGRPEDQIKSVCPTEYDPGAECPEFERFLLSIFDNDMATVDFLRLVLGASLIGLGSAKQWIIILTGQGRNGKDTLIGVIQFVLGSEIMAPIPSELILESGSRSSQGPSADLMKLRGVRTAYANETSQGRSFNVGTAKQLSGGGVMTARPPYGKRNVDWEMTHMLLLMTNAKPRAPIDDYAFWKRIKTINFPLSFVEEPAEPNERLKDPHIAEKLKKEAKGILAWLVQGCLDYQEYGLVEPETVTAANMAYMRDVDLTGLFIEECCVIGPGNHVLFKHLYAAYKQWAQEYGLKPISGKALAQYLGKRFEKEHTRDSSEYQGIGLLNYDQAL